MTSCGLINLLEWLTELVKTFYLLDYQLNIKVYNLGKNKSTVYNLGTAGWKRWVSQGVKKGYKASTTPSNVPLSQHLYVHHSRSSLNSVLLRCYGFIT